MPCQQEGGLSVPMLQMKELRLRKVETPARAHTAHKEPELDTGVVLESKKTALLATLGKVTWKRNNYRLNTCGWVKFSNSPS